MAILRRSRFRFEHEREDRFEDKLRGDGKTVVYSAYLRGQGRKIELLAIDSEHWADCWAKLARLAEQGLPEPLEIAGDEHWSLSLRHDGAKGSWSGDGSPSEELLAALTELLGRTLASAREALLPEPEPPAEEPNAEGDEPA